MLTGVLAFAIGVGIMVLVHEWGHFVVARFFGVRVEVFSIGFGPRIWGVRRGPTDYRLSALPLGGYVRMAGDNPAEERKGEPDEFLSKPRWQRVLIALAGPTTNVLLAVLLTAALFVHGGEEATFTDQPIIVAGVMKDSPAQKAGIQPGDRVVSFAGIKNPTWGRAELEIELPGHSTVPIIVRRGDQLLHLTVDAGGGQQPVEAALGYPAEPVIVGALAHGLPAEAAGLMPEDVIIAAGGKALVSPYQLSENLQQNGGNPLELVVLRNGQKQNIEMKPIWGDPGDGMVRWEIGVSFKFATSKLSYSAPAALVRAGEYQFILADKLVYVLGQLFTAKASLKQFVGPLGMVQMSSEAAKQGFEDVVTLMAMVSLNLGILNLLPIPILDGGHILMLAIESVIRRDISLKIKERVVTVGMVFLLSVFVVVMYNDVLRLFVRSH